MVSNQDENQSIGIRIRGCNGKSSINGRWQQILLSEPKARWLIVRLSRTETKNYWRAPISWKKLQSAVERLNWCPFFLPVLFRIFLIISNLQSFYFVNKSVSETVDSLKISLSLALLHWWSWHYSRVFLTKFYFF